MAFTKITAAGIGSTETVTLDGLSVINDASFNGNVSVGGTLTYEDVTNIDSVGLITARAGVVVGSGITLSKDGDGFFTGVVTATSYAGDGSALTGISVDSTQIVTGDTSVQTVDTGSDGHVKVNTDNTERLRIDSSGIKVGETGANTLIIGSATGIGIATDTITETLEVNGDVRIRNGLKLRSPAGTENGFIGLTDNDNLTLESYGTNSYLTFKTYDGSSLDERLRIGNNGYMSLNTTEAQRLFSVKETNNKASLLIWRTSETNGDYSGIDFSGHPSNNGSSYQKGGIYFQSDGSGFGRGDIVFCNDDQADSDNVVIGDEKMRIHKEGYVTKPNHPCFRAGRSTNVTPGNNGTIVFDYLTAPTHFNQGGHYDSSTGAFTAPVAGVYSFHTHVLYQNLGSGQNMNDAIWFYYNSSGGASGGVQMSYDHRRAEYIENETGTGGYYSSHMTLMVSMAASGSVYVRNNRAGLEVHGNANYTFFQGYLIG